MSTENVNMEINSKNKDIYELIKYIIEKVDYVNSNDIKITKDVLSYKLLLELNTKYDIYKKNKKTKKHILKENMCIGRKLDNHQCTRNRLPGKEFCLSHFKKLTNGRFDQVLNIVKKKERRGRRPKVSKDIRDKNESYCKLFIDVIQGERYFSDINNNVFTYDKEKPRLLGKKTLEGDLVYYPTKTNKEELKDTVKYLEIKN